MDMRFFKKKAMSNMTIVMGAILAMVGILLYLNLAGKGFLVADTATDALMPDIACPEDAKIDDYLKRMQTFSGSSDDNILAEPSYAIDIFEEYMSCTAPSRGESPFSQLEIHQNEPEILVCANAAYIAYLAQLDAQKTASAGFEDDVQYYEDLIEEYNKKYMFFTAIWPESTSGDVICNFAATGRDDELEDIELVPLV